LTTTTPRLRFNRPKGGNLPPDNPASIKPGMIRIRRSLDMSETKSRRRALRRVAAALLGASVVAGLAVALAGVADARSDDPGVKRSTITLQVSLTDNGPAIETLAAVVYEPTAGHIRGIQVMIPGSTYDHRYFDLKTSDGWVSQARKAAMDGWIAVAVDRIGTGNSSHPAADKLRAAAHAATIHQLVTRLKATYRNLPVALVGHSLGSVIAIEEAATYKDVNAIVLTGFLHHAGGGDLFSAMIHPAAEDPAFTNRPVPAGYLTTRPGLRHLFYWPFNADLSTVMADDAVKQTSTSGEHDDFGAELFNDVFGKDVTVPVLSLVGDHDFFFFDPADLAKTIAAEPGAYPLSPSVDVRAIPDAGHDLALQRNGDSTTNLIDKWLSEKL
jgi:pimeloyl-ACP methyl ester carboxylesterase